MRHIYYCTGCSKNMVIVITRNFLELLRNFAINDIYLMVFFKNFINFCCICYSGRRLFFLYRRYAMYKDINPTKFFWWGWEFSSELKLSSSLKFLPFSVCFLEKLKNIFNKKVLICFHQLWLKQNENT